MVCVRATTFRRKVPPCCHSGCRRGRRGVPAWPTWPCVRERSQAPSTPWVHPSRRTLRLTEARLRRSVSRAAGAKVSKKWGRVGIAGGSSKGFEKLLGEHEGFFLTTATGGGRQMCERETESPAPTILFGRCRSVSGCRHVRRRPRINKNSLNIVCPGVQPK